MYRKAENILPPDKNTDGNAEIKGEFEFLFFDGYRAKNLDDALKYCYKNVREAVKRSQVSVKMLLDTLFDDENNAHHDSDEGSGSPW